MSQPEEPRDTVRPSNDPILELRAEMRELLGAVKECTRVALATRSAMNALEAKINMVALAQLAGEAKAINHSEQIRDVKDRIKTLEDLLVAAQ